MASWTVRVTERIGLVAVGLLLVAMVLEGALRLGGWVFLHAQETRNRASLRAPGALRIVCLGESTTAMGGGDSFPSQLDRILNARRKRFSVVSKAVPAIDTDRILAGVPEL